MNTTYINEKISTSQRIVALGLPARQRANALGTLALVKTLMGVFFALGKRLTTHPTLKTQ